MGLEISRQPCVVPRWECVPFNLFYARTSSSRREILRGTYTKERGNRPEQWIGRIGELEREIILAHSCHDPHMKTCVHRSCKENGCAGGWRACTL